MKFVILRCQRTGIPYSWRRKSLKLPDNYWFTFFDNEKCKDNEMWDSANICRVWVWTLRSPSILCPWLSYAKMSRRLELTSRFPLCGTSNTCLTDFQFSSDRQGKIFMNFHILGPLSEVCHDLIAFKCIPKIASKYQVWVYDTVVTLRKKDVKCHAEKRSEMANLGRARSSNLLKLSCLVYTFWTLLNSMYFLNKCTETKNKKTEVVSEMILNHPSK